MRHVSVLRPGGHLTCWGDVPARLGAEGSLRTEVKFSAHGMGWDDQRAICHSPHPRTLSQTVVVGLFVAGGS